MKDLDASLPPGLIGNPTAVPQCSQVVFQLSGFTCPPDTQVGLVHLLFYGRTSGPQTSPVFNIEPPAGQPAELGFSFARFYHTAIFFHLRADGDYGLTAQLRGISEADPILAGLLTIWGVPGSPIHDVQREAGVGSDNVCQTGCPSGIVHPQPFLTMPTACESARWRSPWPATPGRTRSSATACSPAPASPP